MYLSPLERMKKVHIWIGTFSGSEKEYEEDFIGIIPLFNEEQDISILLQEVTIDMDDIEDVLTKCKVMNIKKGNAVLYLTDASLVVPNKENNFNGLKYIGMYNSSL